MEKENKEIPFGAKDSELYKFEYTIPEGYEAEIKDGKVIVKKKESEDERIRKFLVELVSNDKFNGYGGLYKERNVLYDDVLAYLEKLKEQNSVKLIGLTSKKVAIDTLRTVVGLLKEKNLWSGWQDSLLALAKDIESLHIVEPAEWSEEDKEMFFFLNEFMDNKGKDYFSTLVYPKIKIWLNSLPERFNLEPKQKWSEEDEEMCQNILECLRSGWRKLPTDILKCESWLKSLSPQPHWKPSEEQMEELLNALIPGKDFDCDILAELYEQLKVL